MGRELAHRAAYSLGYPERSIRNRRAAETGAQGYPSGHR